MASREWSDHNLCCFVLVYSLHILMRTYATYVLGRGGGGGGYLLVALH